MIYFNRNCEPASDIVVLKVIDSDTLSSKKDGFVIGDDSLRNLRIGFYQIVKIGDEARRQTNLDVGSYVFADKLAAFYHTEPICLMRYNALVMESNIERTKYRALGGRVIVQEEKGKSANTSRGFVIPDNDEMKIGVIKSITPPYEGIDNASDFKVGDRILLTKDERDILHGFTGDRELDPTLPICIYRTSSIICRIED